MDTRILGLLRDAREQLELERKQKTSPIAVVGMGCRFPGGASSPEELWELLCSGKDATSEVPADRWSVEDVYDADPETPGKAYTKRGAFLDRVDAFDASFFNISPREAAGMDPQQRLLLEVAWEALEDAGIQPERLKGTATGVWVGMCVEDYARKSLLSSDRTALQPHNTLGSLSSIAAGRISYVLDLRGPNVQVDTACSSSLVAVHQACQSLRAGECDMAIVGGVNLMLAPEMTIALCKLRALAADGRCKTFDASADGYARGEGCGVLVLRRLDDATAAGDRVHAVVHGSAINHDGYSNGLTAPNGRAQEAVIRAALANGGIEPADVSYVEAHGTGTLLGDPIEVQALARVYGKDRPRERPLLLGTIKTHLGHLEGAAGIAGLIKLVLSVSHGQLTPQLNFSVPNPKIAWHSLPVRVVAETIAWGGDGVPRFAGVSSFGFSGTNAHVIVGERPAPERVASLPVRSSELVLLSARTPEALDAAVGRLQAHLEAHPELELMDVAYSLATTRSLMEQRLALVVPDMKALKEALHGARQGLTPSGAERSQSRDLGKVAWLFTGQGAQRLGMGRELYAEWPVFRAALDEVCGYLDPHLERPLKEVMWAEAGELAALLDETGYTQPALFAFEWALAQLWRSFGVEPDMVLGHSIGEISAACMAGVFSLPDAVRLVCARGSLMQGLRARGAMVSIAAPRADVEAAVAALADDVSIAAINGPSSVVVSGADAGVQSIAEYFSARGSRTKRLKVSHAFHSPLMDPMLEQFLSVAEKISYSRPSVPFVSNLLGRIADDEVTSPRYWVRHVRETVLFVDGVRAAHAAGARSFLEVGPATTLLGLVPAALEESDAALLLASQRPPRGEVQGILVALGGWVAQGGLASWAGVFPKAGRRVQLPTYAWQRQRHWLEHEGASLPANDVEAALRELESRGNLSAAARAALPEIREALLSQRADAAPRAAVHEWLYSVSWRKASVSPVPAAAGRWVLSGEGADVQALSAVLQRAGKTVEVADASNLASALRHPDGVERIVCTIPAVADSYRRVLTMERQIAAAATLPVPVWWLTRGAVGIGAGDPPENPAQALVWGLGRVFALEHPNTWGGIIDLPSGALTASLAEQVAALVQNAAGEDQAALRHEAVFVPRIVAGVAAPAAISSRLRSGTALITGGLGALGLHVARWLVSRGVRSLLLVSRSGQPAASARSALEELRASGAQVTLAAAQVTDRNAMTAALGRVSAEAPVTSVFHAAGVADFTPLEEMTAEHFESVIAAKYQGTLVLDEVTRGLALEAFVCFSSIAGVWGAGQQAAYAAANAHLDAWAHAARAAGRPAYSISWGPWSGGGMADTSRLDGLARRGLRGLAPRDALRALEQVLSGDPAHVTVVDVEWQAFRQSFEVWGPRKFLSEAAASAPTELHEESVDPELAQVLAGLAGPIRLRRLQDWIAEQCAVVLGFGSAAELSRRRGFLDLGFDSLMIVELRRRLEKGLGHRVSPTIAFSHPSIEALAKHLLDDPALNPAPPVRPDAQAAVEVNEAAAPTPGASTDEDLIQFINSRFSTQS